jgi:hypothetical protein
MNQCTKGVGVFLAEDPLADLELAAICNSSLLIRHLLIFKGADPSEQLRLLGSLCF